MKICLPIAESSFDAFLMLCRGGLLGILFSMFGVDGVFYDPAAFFRHPTSCCRGYRNQSNRCFEFFARCFKNLYSKQSNTCSADTCSLSSSVEIAFLRLLALIRQSFLTKSPCLMPFSPACLIYPSTFLISASANEFAAFSSIISAVLFIWSFMIKLAVPIISIKMLTKS